MQPKEIGNRLTMLRGNKPQSEVAKAIGISDSALSMYECGERIPRDSIKIKLAQYYGKSVQSIFLINNDTICDIIYSRRWESELYSSSDNSNYLHNNIGIMPWT